MARASATVMANGFAEECSPVSPPPRQCVAVQGHEMSRPRRPARRPPGGGLSQFHLSARSATGLVTPTATSIRLDLQVGRGVFGAARRCVRLPNELGADGHVARGFIRRPSPTQAGRDFTQVADALCDRLVLAVLPRDAGRPFPTLVAGALQQPILGGSQPVPDRYGAEEILFAASAGPAAGP